MSAQAVLLLLFLVLGFVGTSSCSMSRNCKLQLHNYEIKEPWFSPTGRNASNPSEEFLLFLSAAAGLPLRGEDINYEGFSWHVICHTEGESVKLENQYYPQVRSLECCVFMQEQESLHLILICDTTELRWKWDSLQC